MEEREREIKKLKGMIRKAKVIYICTRAYDGGFVKISKQEAVLIVENGYDPEECNGGSYQEDQPGALFLD